MIPACLEAAREYLRLGLHPIPCAPRSKRPLVEWKRYQTDPPLADEVEVWWETTPDANVALVLGRGTFAVDLDGGSAAQQLLFDRGILLPGAPRSRTANGFHVFLAAPGPVPDRVGLLTTHGRKPQVDIRGVGIVVAPPSVHPDGPTYEWEVPLRLPLPAAPPELLALIESSASAPRDTGHGSGSLASWVHDALAGVGEGARDVTCTRLAGFLLGHGLDAATTESLLWHGFAGNCSPPLDRGTVRKCVHSIDRREAVTGDKDRAISPVPLSAALDALEASWRGAVPQTTRTPYAKLNGYLSGGFAQGELIYLGARPGVGKTAMALAIAAAVARDGLGVLVVSREMVNLALARRMLAQESRVPAHHLKRHVLTLEQQVSVTTSLRALRRLPIWLTDEAVSLGEIVDLATAFEVQHRLGLLIVDYLQLVRAPREVRERRLQVEAVSQGFKTLALALKLPVLCLSSLARPGKEHVGRRPTLDDLRESGELEHDADIVLFLHRRLLEAETECIVAKNRDGAVGIVSMAFAAETLTFTETS